MLTRWGEGGALETLGILSILNPQKLGVALGTMGEKSLDLLVSTWTPGVALSIFVKP